MHEFMKEERKNRALKQMVADFSLVSLQDSEPDSFSARDALRLSRVTRGAEFDTVDQINKTNLIN